MFLSTLDSELKINDLYLYQNGKCAMSIKKMRLHVDVSKQDLIIVQQTSPTKKVVIDEVYLFTILVY